MMSGTNVQRHRIDIQGVVQGIGFRPFVHHLARSLSLTGRVWNHAGGVTVEAQGDAEALKRFLQQLQHNAPPLARIDNVGWHAIPVQPDNGFVIAASVPDATAEAHTCIPADSAICTDCRAELVNAHDRRGDYPFIHCTHCGPRFTIIRDLPYDRATTTMADFTMCEQCELEFHDPASRRFHAQTNACPACGPQIWFEDQQQVTTATAAALDAFQHAIQKDRIVAVKGVGGFHLVCSASSDRAVQRLRQRKGRGDKPFAVMVADLQSAASIAEVSPTAADLLMSDQRPIVLLPKKAEFVNGTRSADQTPQEDVVSVSEHVAPRLHVIGVMLPGCGLQHLLLSKHPVLVMTSGNRSSAPIARTTQAARQQLSHIADAWLLHDREIHVACDDSVWQCSAGQSQPVRRSRGYAPTPLRVRDDGPTITAAGAELKSVFCLLRNRNAWLSQHIGDLSSLETLQSFERSMQHFERLLHVRPAAVACDLHPGYLSSRWAARFAAERQIPLIKVQHHHAHLAALLAEHQCHEPLLGVCMDGTGLGIDGTIQGAEWLLIAEDQCQRLAHLHTLPLAGGDISIQRPYRTALAALAAHNFPWDDDLPCVQACPLQERRVLQTQLQRNVNCVQHSSMGRLFDAVAALIGVRQTITYEAQAAMELEALAAAAIDAVSDFDHRRYWPTAADRIAKTPHVIDTEPLFQTIIAEWRQRVPLSILAARFHLSIAGLIVDVCEQMRTQHDIRLVGLSGGVFQNQLLLQLTQQRLQSAGFRVLIHHQLPANDGGLALGQALVARQRLVNAS